MEKMTLINMFLNILETTDENKDFRRIVREYYLEHSSYPESVKDFDKELYFESAAIATLINPDFKSLGSYLSPSSISYVMPEKCDELNYPEAYLFVKYLIENHGGLDCFISFFMDELSFESAYSMDYDSMKSLWLATLNIY